MTAKELASMLNERRIGDELSHEEERNAKESGLVVVFGASDDLMELRGAINDEAGCYDGGEIYLDAEGVFYAYCEKEDCRPLQQHLCRCKMIEAVWCEGDWPWSYKTDIPHETFDIMEDGTPYCRGIVFEMAALGGTKNV